MPDAPTEVITSNVPRKVIYLLVSAMVAFLVGLGLCIGYSAQAVHATRAANDRALQLAQQNNENAIRLAQQTNLHNLQQICGIISILDEAYRNPQTPPTSALGRKLGDAIHAYDLVLKCASVK